MPAAGLAGFRVGHVEACEARRVAELAGREAGVVRYDEVEAVSLLAEDLERLARFVQRTLGDLAAPGEATTRLRRTLRAWLATGGSAPAAAVRLGVHKNTVLYRVHRADGLLPRPIDADRLRLELALAAAEELGLETLHAATGPPRAAIAPRRAGRSATRTEPDRGSPPAPPRSPRPGLSSSAQWRTSSRCPATASGPRSSPPPAGCSTRWATSATRSTPFGGAAIDAHGTRAHRRDARGVPRADAVLLAAVGGPKWDSTDPAAPRPEQGLLGLRKGLGPVRQPAPRPAAARALDASPLKREVLEGTDLLVVRELTGGIYFGDEGARGRPRARRLRLQRGGDRADRAHRVRGRAHARDQRRQDERAGDLAPVARGRHARARARSSRTSSSSTSSSTPRR